MHAVFIVAIIFGSIVTLAGLLCITVLVIMRNRHGGLTSRARKASRDEAQMIQEIYRALEQMEQRIETLETILMDGHETHREKQ